MAKAKSKGGNKKSKPAKKSSVKKASGKKSIKAPKAKPAPKVKASAPAPAPAPVAKVTPPVAQPVIPVATPKAPTPAPTPSPAPAQPVSTVNVQPVAEISEQTRNSAYSIDALINQHRFPLRKEDVEKLIGGNSGVQAISVYSATGYRLEIYEMGKKVLILPFNGEYPLAV